MTLSLRPVGVEALATLVAYHAQLSIAHGHDPAPEAAQEAKLRAVLACGHDAYLIERDGAAVGYAVLRDNGDHVFVKHFLIDQAARGAGLGRAAFALIERLHPGRQFRLDASLTVDQPKAFWSALGFKPVAWSMRREAA